jgi:hypothetical protein
MTDREHAGILQLSTIIAPLLSFSRGVPRRVAPRPRRAFVALAVAVASTPLQAQENDPTLFYRSESLTLRWHLEAGAYAGAERDVFWNLAATTAPDSGYDPDKNWQEFYIKPGVSFEYDLGGATLYGRLSAVSSYTLGIDPLDQGDNGATTLEEAYLAVRGETAGGLSYDLSLGARELRLGTGMLIFNGGSSGFERGAMKFGPRKAWEKAAIGTLSGGGYTGTVFYLQPNELPSSDGKNELAGFDLRHDAEGGGYLGGTFVDVLNSETPYPQAAPGGGGVPTVTPGAREDTKTINLYGRTDPFDGALSNWAFTGDLAYQWNDRIDLNAWAGRMQAIYTFADARWAPILTVSYQTFSGDDPDTTTLERYDPLYWEGSPSAWATGSKSAATFINSNVNALNLALALKPSPRDTLTFRYSHIRANELNSPIQFGQAARVNVDGNVVAGVTDPHLADDLYVEYNRVINSNTFLTAGASVSFPGKGIDEVVGESAPNWTGLYLNVVVSF